MASLFGRRKKQSEGDDDFADAQAMTEPLGSELKKAQVHLAKRDLRCFDAIKAMVIKQDDSNLRALTDSLDWRDANTLDFLFCNARMPETADFLLQYGLPHLNGKTLLSIYSRANPQNSHFFYALPLALKMLFIPFVGFDYINRTMHTKKSKTDQKLKLDDFIQDEAFITGPIAPLLNYINQMMKPYQSKRINRHSEFKQEKYAEYIFELICLFKRPDDKAITQDEILQEIRRIPINLETLYQPFDQFLIYLTDNATQQQYPYIHHLLWFFERGAYFHDNEKTTVKKTIDDIMGYFNRHMTNSPRIFNHNKKNPEMLFYQQLYLCGLIIMGAYFSDKNMMNINIRPHMERIREQENYSTLYHSTTKSISDRERAEFTYQFKRFTELVHMQGKVFIVEAKLFENEQTKHKEADGVHKQHELKASPENFGRYFTFMQNLFSQLSENEIDTLCYNPTFCITLYKNFLKGTTQLSAFPKIDQIDSPLKKDKDAFLSTQEIETLWVKCWRYVTKSEKSIENVLTDKQAEEKARADAAAQAALEVANGTCEVDDLEFTVVQKM